MFLPDDHRLQITHGPVRLTGKAGLVLFVIGVILAATFFAINGKL